MNREQTFEAILASIEASKLPESHTAPLKEAIEALYASRPNAVDKIQAPLGRALRNPTFPGIWDKAVADIPKTPAYMPLHDAAEHIATLVQGS